jgi:hypothetical protein
MMCLSCFSVAGMAEHAGPGDNVLKLTKLNGYTRRASAQRHAQFERIRISADTG